MRLILAAMLATTALATASAPLQSAPAVPEVPNAAASAFAALSKRYVAGIAELSPTYATTLGDHRFDGDLPDISAAGRAKAAAFDRALLADLAKIDRAALSRDDQVDAALLENALKYDLWQIEVLQPWAWDTQYHNGIAGDALYGLAARDFAPWDVRMKAAITRMEKLPALFAQTRATLVPARVPPVFATTVQRQNAGILDIARDMLAPHKDALSPADQARFDKALKGLEAAVAEQQAWIDTVLVPQAKGDFRLGTKLYDEKLRFTLQSDLTRPQIKAKAEQAAKDIRAEMYALARQVLAGREGAPATPDNPSADQLQAAVEAALELSYAKRPARGELMDKAKATLAQATDFARKARLVTVPETPVKIITMPKFQQGFAVAYCDSPGALERNLDTFYAISPIPEDWSDEQATSFLREYNDYMIHELSIHEAMPGHYLQIAHSNTNQSVLRAVLASGSFVEGWAVYSEGLMSDADYLDGDPLFKLTVLKMRLRSVTNSLLDIGIQTEGMTREQAMELMTRGAFQQEREAAGKWVRANLSSTQLLSYFVGYEEHMALRAEMKAKQGAAFDLMAYNDAVLSHGSPPARYVRALMLGLPVD
ncbi:DUF885 domain-containing protein [Sphingomonas canadensis]|uniref:DUF885 domain-containing protein n=1 Tax=Sphingomonas canadensis TaxID=1219257 RepID=A0ABW3H8H0_9SPHN|nr:DUF885 domain-containing protein [Sphingomonas canadensis]MCW3836148.1 DUF885 domain-containing protein [Sphingomonas canadensis]